ANLHLELGIWHLRMDRTSERQSSGALFSGWHCGPSCAAALVRDASSSAAGRSRRPRLARGASAVALLFPLSCADGRPPHMSSACPGKVFCAPVIGLAGTAGGGRCDPFRDPFCGGWGGGDFSGGGGGEPRAPRRSARDTGSKQQNETNRMRLQDSLGCRQNMNSFVATLAMLFRSEDLLTDLDLLVIAIATALWIWGILEARRRRVSPKLQLLFTLIMLGGASGDILTRLIVSSRTNLAYLIGSSLL